MSNMMQILGPNMRYWLAEHPTVSRFRWDHNAWGSSIVFLAMAIWLYLVLILVLKSVMRWRKKPLALGPIPGIHNLMVLAMSAVIVVGCWEATAVEIEETRWIRRRRTAVEWMVCFPLGTRSTGRVFFWSYLFYLTKYYELADTFIMIMRKRPVTFLHLFFRIGGIFSSFFWLEFSQSLQIVEIFTNALAHVIVYSDFLLRGSHLAPLFTKTARLCLMTEFALTFVGNVWLVALHLRKEGCNGIVGCLFNAGYFVVRFLLFVGKEKTPNLQEQEEGSRIKEPQSGKIKEK